MLDGPTWGRGSGAASGYRHGLDHGISAGELERKEGAEAQRADAEPEAQRSEAEPGAQRPKAELCLEPIGRRCSARRARLCRVARHALDSRTFSAWHARCFNTPHALPRATAANDPTH